ELDHRPEHLAVLLAVEVLRPQVLLDQQAVQVTLVEQHRAEHRLLCLQVVRWYGDVLNGAHEPWSEDKFGSGGPATETPLPARTRVRSSAKPRLKAEACPNRQPRPSS